MKYKINIKSYNRNVLYDLNFILVHKFGIRIVADCGTQIFQFTRMLKLATNLDIKTVSLIFHIHCYAM